MKNNLNKLYCLVALTSIFIMGCSKMDDYKAKYLSGGSTFYPGIIDSVMAFSGKERAKITGLFTSDPKIVKYRVFWNSKRDSIEMPVNRTSGVDTASVIINGLPEGLMNFELRTYDAQNDISIPVYTSVQVYGDLYQSSLQNRSIDSTRLQTDNIGIIYWADVNNNAGVIGMQIRYTDNIGSAHDTTIIYMGSTQSPTLLSNYKPGNKFQYRTLFKPVSTAIDTFYTAFEDHTVSYDVDITSQYLINISTPFKGEASPDGRFAKLAAPWITNAAGLNKGGGTYGGWAAEPWQGTTGFINWETYGSTPVTDGIIYQPTSLALPAGNYSIVFNDYSEIQTNSSVYCIAAAGAAGIPTLANLSTALGFAPLYNGANVGANNPSTTETKKFSFTVTTPQVISIGFLGNLTENNYFIVKDIKLLQNF